MGSIGARSCRGNGKPENTTVLNESGKRPTPPPAATSFCISILMKYEIKTCFPTTQFNISPRGVTSHLSASHMGTCSLLESSLAMSLSVCERHFIKIVCAVFLASSRAAAFSTIAIAMAVRVRARSPSHVYLRPPAARVRPPVLRGSSSPSSTLVLRLAGLRSTTRDHKRAGGRARALLRKQAFPRSLSHYPRQTNRHKVALLRRIRICDRPADNDRGRRPAHGRSDRNLSKKHAHKRGRDAPSSVLAAATSTFQFKASARARSRSLHQLFPLASSIIRQTERE